MVMFIVLSVLISIMTVLLLQPEYIKGIVCIDDLSHNRNPQSICNATSQECYISRIMVEMRPVVMRGCFKPTDLDPVCDTHPPLVVMSCCSENLCNNVSEPEHIKDVANGPSTERAEVPILTTSIPSDVKHGTALYRLQTILPAVIFFIGITILVFIIIFIVYRGMWKKRTHKQDGNEEDPYRMVGFRNQTVSSGSGFGLKYIVQRTISQDVTLCEKIGAGRFGTVFVGIYQGEKVAVKKFATRNELAWSRESEIYNTVWLHHDNILRFIASDIFSNDGITELWLIVQYHTHGTLYEYLTRQILAPEVMMRMAISMSRGLTFLHTDIHGLSTKPAVAHRDFKSENILVKNDLECCICDFGHAVIEIAPNLVSSPISIHQGTRRYMSPEILAETMDVTAFTDYLQADMYALGLILWELSTRCKVEIENYKPNAQYLPPFDSLVPADPSIEDMRRVVLDRKQRPPLPPAWMKHKMMSGLVGMMKECWYFNSSARPSSVYVKEKLHKLALLSKLNTESPVSWT